MTGGVGNEGLVEGYGWGIWLGGLVGGFVNGTGVVPGVVLEMKGLVGSLSRGRGLSPVGGELSVYFF